MKTLVTLSALTLASAMYAAPASAGCTDPRHPEVFDGSHRLFARMSEEMGKHEGGHSHNSIVGTWHVTYTTEGAPGGEAFIQWHSDGTEWENINFPILGGNICMGSWKKVDGDRVFRNHVGWLYTNGLLTGSFVETETDQLSKDGNSYTGSNETWIYDLDGNLQVDLLGTAAATRIAP